MPDFDAITLQPYIFILVGIALMLIAIFKKPAKSRLKKSGLKTEGIIYALGAKPDNTSSISDYVNIKDKVTVRFVTKNKEAEAKTESMNKAID